MLPCIPASRGLWENFQVLTKQPKAPLLVGFVQHVISLLNLHRQYSWLFLLLVKSNHYLCSFKQLSFHLSHICNYSQAFLVPEWTNPRILELRVISEVIPLRSFRLNLLPTWLFQQCSWQIIGWKRDKQISFVRECTAHMHSSITWHQNHFFHKFYLLVPVILSAPMWSNFHFSSRGQPFIYLEPLVISLDFDTSLGKQYNFLINISAGN